MKRHVQTTGVRQWAGDDLIELQNEPLTVLDNFFKQYDQLIVSGCTIVNDQVSEGLIGLWGFDPENKPVYKVAPLVKHSGVKFPVYAYLKYTVETRQYGDGNTKPVKEVYTAELSETPPTNNTPYLTIHESGNKRFNEAIQDSKHNFVTDTDLNKLSPITNEKGVYSIDSEGILNLTTQAGTFIKNKLYVNGEEITSQTTYPPRSYGLYKIAVDDLGHVYSAGLASKTDIGLGKVENVAALPLTGGELTGNLTLPKLISQTTTEGTSNKLLATDGGVYEVCALPLETSFLKKIPIIDSNGVLNVGQEIKLNLPNSEANYDTRIYYDTNNHWITFSNRCYFPSGFYDGKSYNSLEVKSYRLGSAYLYLGTSHIRAYTDSSGNTLETLTLNSNVKIDANGNISTSGSINGNVASDCNFKKGIKRIKSALDTVLNLRPVSFKWNDKIKDLDASRAHDKTVLGFIAQEVENVLPDVVGNIYTEEFKALDQTQFIPLLTAAIQEQQKTIEELKKRLEELERKL